MRENLFHGKRKDNGDWVEGCLLGSDVIVPKGQPFYICHNILDSALKAYEVIPETVGQHIERKDKNGTKIFEGDIVRDAETSDVGKIFFDTYTAMFVIGFENTIADFNASYSLEVIGNIYDNPELIGGTNDG
nr:MAG TPA_asm: YopX protein [Caudoviricetes sp.]